MSRWCHSLVLAAGLCGACSDDVDPYSGPCELLGVDETKFEVFDVGTNADLFGVVPGIGIVGAEGTLVTGTWSVEVDLRLQPTSSSATLRGVAIDPEEGSRVTDLVGDDGTVLWNPSDPQVWESVPIATSASLRAIVRGDGLYDDGVAWVAVGENAVLRRLLDSPNGFDLVELHPFYDLWAMSGQSWGKGPGDVLWAVGDGGVIIMSYDAGATWERYHSPTETDLRVVSAPRSRDRGWEQAARLWVGGTDGELWSIDVFEPEPRWVREVLPTEADLTAISMGEATVWVVGADGLMLRRVEGGDWEIVETPAGATDLNAIGRLPYTAWFGNTHFVVGNGGLILRVSADVHWGGHCPPPGF